MGNGLDGQGTRGCDIKAEILKFRQNRPDLQDDKFSL